MFGLELPEIIMLVLVFGILFGGNKISGLAHSLGRFSGEFKKGQLEIEEEIKKVKKGMSSESK